MAFAHGLVADPAQSRVLPHAAMRNRPILLPLLALTLIALACRTKTAPDRAAPGASGDREALLRQISLLPEMAPCLVGGGGPGIRLTDAELAGDAATASFACTRA